MEKTILAKVWQKRNEFRDEGSKLWDEGNRLQDEADRLQDEGDKFWADNLRAEADKLVAEGTKLWAGGDKLWVEAVIETHGYTEIEWIRRSEKKEDACKLGTGEIFEP